jgi:hypothetical protein
MGLAVAGGTVAAGGLAVLVAGGECFPLCGRDGGGGAADVEDFGAAGEDDAAEVAVAGEELDHRLGEPAAGVPFGPGAGDQVGRISCGLVDVDHGGDVRSDVVDLAALAAVEVAAADVHERVEAALWGAAGVGGLEVAGHFGVEGGFDDLGVQCVAVGVEVERAVQGPRHIQRAPFVFGFVGGGAAVAVERVGDMPDDPAEILRIRLAGVADQRGLDRADLRGSFGCVRGRDHHRVPGGDVAVAERGRDLGQTLELAGQLHVRAGDTHRQVARVP